jgi:hypothetical protein
MNGDLTYRNRRDARGKFSQQGRFNQLDLTRRPLTARLRLYERMARQDLTIKSSLHVRTNSVISSIGSVTHEDPEISEFLQNVIDNFEQNRGKGWKDALYTLLWTSYWSGFSITETMWDLKFGALYLDDLLTYHPISIALYPDKNGRFTEGKETYDRYHRSGIYQTAISPFGAEQSLSAWKMIYLAREADFGNHYGRSLIAPSYKWYRLKEAVIDMMAASLERMGRRLTYVISPSYELPDELRLDPATGEERPITTLQLIAEQFSTPEGVGDSLMVPQQSTDIKVNVGSVPLADNFGNSFLDHIAYLDEESTKQVAPYFLLSDRTQSSENQERRLEVYFNTIDQDREALTRVLINKIFVPLIQWNFSRESARNPPTFTRVYSDRPEDRVATMQMVKGLTEAGYLNPKNPQDWDMVRQMVRLADRPLKEEDLEFIQEILINPRQKNPREDDVGPGGSGSPGKRTGTSMPNQKAKLKTP